MAYDVKVAVRAKKTNGRWFCAEHCERFDNQLQKGHPIWATKGIRNHAG